MPNKLHKFTQVLIVFITIISPVLAVFPSSTFAADIFSYDYTTTYTVQSTKSLISVQQSVKIQSQSQSYKVSKGSEWEFIIPIQRDPDKMDEIIADITPTISVKTSGGTPITYRTEKDTSTLSIFATIPSDVNPYNSLTLVLTYSTPELYEKVGKVTNIYIPGLDSDTDFERKEASTGVTHKTTFISQIKLPKSLGDPSLTTITPNRKFTESNYNVIEYKGEQLLGNSAWIQFGKSQIYKFEISQKPVTRSVTDLEKFLNISTNEYTIIIPADAEYANQTVSYTQITPTPEEITLTDEGNLKAKFRIESDYKSNIVIKGYITIDHSKETEDFDETGTFSDIPDHYEYLTDAAPYWQSDESEIIKKAKELKGTSTNVLDVVENTYNFVVDSIDYDDKYVYGKPRERQGALATLEGAKSVCMEYSDLFIALSRAQGIPARAAFGSGYDPNMPPDQQVGHQWVQVWIPKIGWLTVDTTWGESGRDFIGYDVDHALWLVREESPEIPSEVELLAHSNIDSLDAPESSFTPVEKIDPADNDSLMSQTELLDEYGGSTGNQIRLDASLAEFFEKIPGFRLFMIIIPALILVMIISAIISAVKRVRQQKKYEKGKELQKAQEKIEAKKQETVLKQVSDIESQEKIRKSVTQKKYDLTDPFGGGNK